jgi:hypothetical protein
MVTWICLQAYKYIFTSPSSVDKEPKATRLGNARIHGMTRVTMPSIAYVATQVNRLHFIHKRVFIPAQYRFASHCLHHLFFPEPILSQTQRGFITQCLTFSTMWKNRKRSTNFKHGGIGLICLLSLHYSHLMHRCNHSQIFPSYSSARRSICKHSALARIKEKRAEMKVAENV